MEDNGLSVQLRNSSLRRPQPTPLRRKTKSCCLCSPPLPSDVDHLLRHASVDDNILAGHKTALRRCEKDRHSGNILHAPYPADGMLGMIHFAEHLCLPPAAFLPGGNVDPAGADAVDPDFRSETDGERMGERQAPLSKHCNSRCPARTSVTTTTFPSKTICPSSFILPSM